MLRLSNSSVMLRLACAALVAISCGCSPIAPSVDKSQLVESQPHASSDSNWQDDGGVPGASTADMKDVILYRGTGDEWKFVGADARDSFFQSQPKPLAETELSPSLLKQQFQDFLSNRSTQVPITMTNLAGTSISALKGSVVLEATLDVHLLTPELLNQLNVTVTPGKSGADGTLYWDLAIPSTVPDSVARTFLTGLTQLTVITSCSSTSGAPAAGSLCAAK